MNIFISEMKRIRLFHEALDKGLQALGREKTLLKEQYEALKAIVVDKDCRVILPTGFGKSPIYQLLPHTLGVKSLSPVNTFSFLTDMPTLPLNTPLYRYIEWVFT